LRIRAPAVGRRGESGRRRRRGRRGGREEERRRAHAPEAAHRVPAQGRGAAGAAAFALPAVRVQGALLDLQAHEALALPRRPRRGARMSALREPEPPFAGAPRYAPQRPFPPYRFVPGLNPHPVSHPQGHSYRGRAREEPPPRFAPERWRENVDFLHGCDLYNHAYWWEAHEAWEGLWHLTRK